MMITSPGHVPRRGHRGVATVTPCPGVSRRGQAQVGQTRALVLEPADARLLPERPMGRTGTRSSETAEGLKISNLSDLRITNRSSSDSEQCCHEWFECLDLK